MQLTESEIRHFKNVLWGTRFWRWFRWVLVAALAYVAIPQLLGWRAFERTDWLVVGAVYLLVAWPGLCRVYVFHTLHRLVSQDPEARAQLAEAGVNEFKASVPANRV